jgi:hypothetical protein
MDTPPAPTSLNLPPGLVMAEQMTAAVRRYLQASGLGGWTVFFTPGPDLGDIDGHLPALGESAAAWEPLPGLTAGGVQPALAVPSGKGGEASGDGPTPDAPPTNKPAAPHVGPDLYRPGGLLLRSHGVLIARWHYLDLHNGGWSPAYLYAAESAVAFRKLRERVGELRHLDVQASWQVVDGNPWPGETLPRDALATAWDRLVLRPDLRQRLDAEVTGFFSPPVAAVYADLGVPYRRGVLMYGPPGNGKTSLVRAIGASVPTIPGLILRPADDFDDRGLQNVLGQWQERAPAILVIEDLDWLFRQTRISVSAFLNALDGVGRRDGGLLLLATTNHPDALDPAINNRPGRFDVVVEVAPPDEPMRRQFLAGGRIGQLGDAVLDRTAADTDGLSFGHLRELETLSGLRAVAAGRTARSPADVADAVDLVVAGHRRAGDGFAPPPGSDFGLRPARSRRPRETAAVSEDDIPF